MKSAVAILLAIIFFACNAPVQKNTAGTATADDHLYDSLQATYSGDFGGSELRLVLTHVTGRHAVGYNLNKGLRRNMSGKMQDSAGTFMFILNEPGDHPFDGKFTFTIDTTTYTLTGNWTPLNDKSLKEKIFTLHKITSSDDVGLQWGDSTGDFFFSSNGICTYEYYPKVDGKEAEQLIRVKGTWTLKDSIYTIDWEQNTVLPSRRSTFKHIVSSHGDDYNDEVLVGDGRTLREGEF